MAAAKRSAGVAKQFLAAFIANIIWLNTGFLLGWSAVAIPALESNGTLGAEQPLDRPLSAEESSWAATVMVLLTGVGPAASSLLSQRRGFKLTGYAVGLVALSAGLAVLLARSFSALLAGRVLAGVGCGCTSVVSTNYIAGAAQEHVRGALATFFALMFNAGVLLAYLVGAVASYRAVCAVGVAIPAVYIVCFFFLPESPQYLLSKDRIDEATKSLSWFRGSGHDVEAEMKQLRANIEEREQASHGRKMTVVEFFRNRACRRGFVTFIILCLNQQLNGSLVVMSYVVEMFSAAGGSIPAEWSAVVVATLQFAATFLSSAMVDRAGRRPLLLGSNAGMAACLMTLGCYFFVQDYGIDVGAIWWLPVASMSLLLVLNAIGIGALLMVIVNEFFSPEALPIAMSVGLLAGTVITTAVVKLYVVLRELIDIFGCYWLFACCCMLSNIYIFFYLPETKNRPINDILSELSGERKKKRKIETGEYDPVSVTESQK